MKKLLYTLCLCALFPAKAHAATDTVSVCYNSVEELPERVITLDDLVKCDGAVDFKVPDLNQLPQLSLPPTGGKIDVSGVYHCAGKNDVKDYDEYIAIHNRGDHAMLLINLSHSLGFLKDFRLISEEDVQAGGQRPVEDFAFFNAPHWKDVSWLLPVDYPEATTCAEVNYGDYAQCTETEGGLQILKWVEPGFYFTTLATTLYTVRYRSLTWLKNYPQSSFMDLEFHYRAGEKMELWLSRESGVFYAYGVRKCRRVF